MPIRAFRFALILAAVSASGCSVWPSEDHRAVTMDSIRAAIDEARANEPPPPPPPEPVALPPVVQCQDLTGVEELLDRQRLQMVRMNKQLQALTAATPAFAAADCPAQTGALDGKTIIGESEWIYLAPPGHHYQARVDSGAATSSLSATNITPFERNGEKWVRFWLQHDDESTPIEVEAPLVRYVRIRQASADGIDRRPVVGLTVYLGKNLQQNSEFTLTDRSQMTYPILLGREFLRDVTLIDVGRNFIHPKYVPEVSPVAPAKAAPKNKNNEPAPAAEASGSNSDSK